MSIEKFNEVHKFITNLDDDDIVRGNTKKDESSELFFPKIDSIDSNPDKATTTYLYVRTGFFGKLWQKIFSGSEGAKQRREEGKTAIMEAIDQLKNIHDDNIKINKNIEESIEKIKNLTADTSKDFDTVQLKLQFRILSIYANKNLDENEISLSSGTPYTRENNPENTTIETDNNKRGAADSAPNSMGESTLNMNLADEVDSIFNGENAQHSLSTETSNPAIKPNQKDINSELDSHKNKNVHVLEADKETTISSPVIKDVKKESKDKFGLISIKESRPIFVNNHELGVFCADAYIAPEFYSNKINLLDKINGQGSPVTENLITSSDTLKITSGTQKLLEIGESIHNKRPFYKLTASAPDFEFKIERDLTKSELIIYKKACSDYQAELLKIYSDTFDKLLELQQENSDSPIRTIALIPLARQAGQLREIEIEVLVSYLTLFQQLHPEVRIAIVTNSEAKRTAIVDAFKSQ